LTELRSWNDGAPKQAIVEFTETAVRELLPEERVAVFDNDGTLWCEKPMPIELGSILQRFVTMAEEDASLLEKQPWTVSYEKDYAWLGGAVDKHYAGYDSDLQVLMGAFFRHTAARMSRSSRPPPRPSWPTRTATPRCCASRAARAGRRSACSSSTTTRARVRLREGAEQALERAKAEGWTVISVKEDWARVFADQ
jgi:hypothetical protein